MADGLGAFRQITREPARRDRLPTQTTAELIELRRVADEVRGIADDIDPGEDEQDDKPQPHYLRGEFGANLAEDDELSESDLMGIARDLLEGIDADLRSRRDWEEITAKAIEYEGLKLEEASDQANDQNSISKGWHTLMLEASLNFWANASAEFLPADGPVKVRDDKRTEVTPPPQMGDNGGPPMNADDQSISREDLADALESDMNHYLTSVDKQYYRDFTRMLWSLGPVGTQFRKVYYNPLRKMVVSEWVKAENLIVSNEAVHLATAGRVTERIMMRHSDVKRLQWMKFWLDVPLVTPTDQPTTLEQTIGATEGIQRRRDLPADKLHEIYECRCERDLEGFEHTEEGERTFLPLPYKITIDKDSRKVLDIRRNWKEDDDDFKERQRYVMFGLVPGFGFYYLGFIHLLGNTERALTALQREVIDVGMMSIFPAWLAEKGALPRGTTRLRMGPGGVTEIDTQMKKSVGDALQSLPVKPLDTNVMALIEHLEQNGKNLSSKLDLQVGEGTANIPVGTMVAMIEQSATVMKAVHKGLHASRAEEFELLRELIAEDPTMLTKFNKSPAHDWQTDAEFEDMHLVPASDPNTPSHIHRIMRESAMMQIATNPNAAPYLNVPEILEVIFGSALQLSQPKRFLKPPGSGAPPQPPPQVVAANAKIQTAQIQASSKAQDLQAQAQESAADRASKEKIAQLDSQSEQVKSSAEVQGDQAKAAHQVQAQGMDAAAQRAHDVGMQREQNAHEANEGALGRMQPAKEPK